MTQQQPSNHIPEAKKMVPGDELHLALLMAPYSLNFFTGHDRQHLLAFGRAAFEAGQAAAQQAVQPSPEATSIAPTFMTNDQAIAWAWADVRKDVGTENWTTGDSCNFYGFFLHGWNYRGQYELQRNATKAAVMREIADTCDYELQQAPAHPAEGVPAQASEWDGKLPERLQSVLNALRLELPTAVVNDVEFEVRRNYEAMHTSLSTSRRMYSAARDRLDAIDAAQPDPFAATHPYQQGMDVIAGAIALCKHAAKIQNIDFDDYWAIHSDEFKEEAKLVLDAAQAKQGGAA